VRAVIDTNVLFSALITPGNSPELIYEAWRDKKFLLVTSTFQLDEIRRASRYAKFKANLQPHRVGRMMNHLRQAIIVVPAPIAEEIDDPMDIFLLGMAQTGGADYLVTGDKRAGLLALKTYGRTKIVTPTEFISAIEG
jgi:uncharacterized protein